MWVAPSTETKEVSAVVCQNLPAQRGRKRQDGIVGDSTIRLTGLHGGEHVEPDPSELFTGCEWKILAGI